MLPKTSPIAKTAIDLRRSLVRLENYKESFPNDEHIALVDTLIADIKEVRRHIPKDLIDIDLSENK